MLEKYTFFFSSKGSSLQNVFISWLFEKLFKQNDEKNTLSPYLPIESFDIYRHFAEPVSFSHAPYSVTTQ
jgi:hypothetical protein